MAHIKPNFPISLAMISNFSYKGVIYYSPYFKSASIFPSQVFSPTTKIINLPSPVRTLVPDIITGLGTS